MSQKARFENVDMIFEGRLRGNQLMLSGKGLTAEEAKLLWESPRMEEISWLDLDDNQLGDEGVQDLVNCPLLENIQYLNLNKNKKFINFLKKMTGFEHILKEQSFETNN